MGVHYPLELIVPITNVSVASIQILFTGCVFRSQAEMANQSSTHEYFTLSPITRYCVEKGVYWSGPSSSVLQSYPIVGSQVPVESYGGQCSALFLQLPCLAVEMVMLGLTLPDAVGALVKALCC